MATPTAGASTRKNRMAGIKNIDVIVSVIVIGIIGMIILPVPPALLDILLAVNITLAMLILLLTMFTTRVLDLSVFPTLLLVTTLFRLGLNISSTRLILTEGNAGEVITAFGNFVTGSNYVVGVIIFLIITIVQFIVITNGSGRIAEVAARFTLDAMPGKQMSIDADLNTGIINETEARQRRSDLQREADFYGAMDGANKFVKGDAITGIIIVFVNFIGGVIIFALMRGVPVVDALTQFATLTIGDGLVSQIPALLISTSAGILVTRSAAVGGMGTEVTKQLFSNPRALGVASGVLGAIAIVPAMPTIPFFIMAAICGVGAFFLGEEKKQKVESAQEAADVPIEDKPVEREPEDVSRYIQVEALEMEIGYGLIPLAEKADGGDLLERISAIRKQSAIDMGILIQPIRIRDNLQLAPDEYIIKIRGNEVADGTVYYNKYLVMDPGNNQIDMPGIPTTEPAFGLPAVWVDEDQKEDAERRGYTIVDPTTVMATHLSETIKLHSHELMGRQEAKRLIDNIKETYSAVVDELIPGMMSHGDVQKVLQNLLREQVPIKDLLTILETLADYADTVKDPEVLTEYVRHKLGRTITMAYLNFNNKLDIITIHPKLEQYIFENIQKSFQGSFPAIDPDVNTKVLESIDSILIETQTPRPVILASPRVRVAFKRLIEMAFPQLAVLSLNEIPNTIDLEGIGMVRVDDH